MRECFTTTLDPLVDRTQKLFDRRASLRAALGKATHYQSLVRSLVTDVSDESSVKRRIGWSVAGLVGVVVYEWARHEGAPLPELNLALGGLASGCIGKKTNDVLSFDSGKNYPVDKGAPVDWDHTTTGI